MNGFASCWPAVRVNDKREQCDTKHNAQEIYLVGKHSLARGLEERDPEDNFSRQINFQCIVFCVTLLPLSFFVVFCVIVFPRIPP